jgi:hypothetical protein
VKARFRGQHSNLHKVWDTDILKNARVRPKAPAEALVGRLSRDDRVANEKGPPSTWATESHDFARDFICARLGPRQSGTLEPILISDTYAADALPVIQLQIARAGVPLAAMLDRALK